MELTAYVHASVHDLEAYTVFGSSDLESCGFVLISKVPVTFDPPPREQQIAKHIEVLRKEQSKVRAEAESKANRLDEVIQSLLCLEYKPEVV